MDELKKYNLKLLTIIRDVLSSYLFVECNNTFF